MENHFFYLRGLFSDTVSYLKALEYFRDEGIKLKCYGEKIDLNKAEYMFTMQIMGTAYEEYQKFLEIDERNTAKREKWKSDKNGSNEG